MSSAGLRSLSDLTRGEIIFLNYFDVQRAPRVIWADSGESVLTHIKNGGGDFKAA